MRVNKALSTHRFCNPRSLHRVLISIKSRGGARVPVALRFAVFAHAPVRAAWLSTCLPLTFHNITVRVYCKSESLRRQPCGARGAPSTMPRRSWTTILAPLVQVPQNRPEFPSTATSCRLSALDSSDNGWQCACNAVEQTMRHVPTYAKAQRAGGGVNICCGIQSCRACARDGLPTLSTGSRLQPIRCTRLE